MNSEFSEKENNKNKQKIKGIEGLLFQISLK
jgi:hypothetical protein